MTPTDMELISRFCDDITDRLSEKLMYIIELLEGLHGVSEEDDEKKQDNPDTDMS